MEVAGRPDFIFCCFLEGNHAMEVYFVRLNRIGERVALIFPVNTPPHIGETSCYRRLCFNNEVMVGAKNKAVPTNRNWLENILLKEPH